MGDTHPWSGMQGQHFPESTLQIHCVLSKVVARVKSVMTHGADFGSCLKIAEGLVNFRKAREGDSPSAHDDSGWSVPRCQKARSLQATCCQLAEVIWCSHGQ